MAEIGKIKQRIDTAIRALNDARRKAEAAGNPAAAKTAAEQSAKLTKVSNKLQLHINENRAADLDALADLLEASIRAQTAVSLLDTARQLAEIVREAVGRVVPVAGPVAVETGTGGRATGGGTSGTGGESGGPIVSGDDAGGGSGTGGSSGGSDTRLPAGRLVARAGKHKAVIDAVIAGCEVTGIDPLLVLPIIHVETGGSFDITIQNSLGSASGLFQFVDKTWLALGGIAHGPGGTGHGHAGLAPLDEQVRIGCRFATDNLRALTQEFGRIPRLWELYLSHMGLGNMRKVLRADPNTPMEEVLGSETARINGFKGLTAGGATQMLARKLDEHLADVRMLLQPAAGESGTGVAGGSGLVTGTGGSGAAGDAARPIAMRALTVAVAERDQFALKDGAVVKEGQEPLHSRARAYLTEVHVENPDPTETRWSAAFISHVMRQAGASTDKFRFSAGHWAYIFAALRNTVLGRPDAFLTYADRADATPRVGDLVGFSTTDSIKTTEDLKARLPRDPADDHSKSFFSHTDFVLSIGNGGMTVIGGNKSNTIGTAHVPLTPDGKIDPGSKYFFILRVNG